MKILAKADQFVPPKHRLFKVTTKKSTNNRRYSLQTIQKYCRLKSLSRVNSIDILIQRQDCLHNSLLNHVRRVFEKLRDGH